ncbi:hypothetical protein FRX94_04410 [Corynebacterium canis]|uniref:Low molecular weight antigen MTB12-like C-terminal domain-containing protein n=1 Tax=Corynebacterium canis TaxID=679663 RepID=A0A5C5UN39_9CORY|nr:hypothetical protein [Corynebacterium canis]TWT26850.1 hypothetical protein FRX94_04410 [Corynebacterium canis]WJY74432.1 hypothetical protein CCANI_02875 [Corynebacterium canis]
MTTDTSTARRGGRTAGEVNWPTVLTAMGCSALISAVVIVGGAFGILRYSTDLVAQSQAAQRPVAEITLGGATTERTQTAGVAATPRAAAPAQNTQTAAVAPVAPAAGGGDAGAAVAPVAQPEAPAPAAEPAIPPGMDAAQLQGHLGALLHPHTPAGDIASNLEGGEAGLPTVSAIAQALELSKAVYSWSIKEGSVYVDGSAMHATLVTTLVGMGSREQQLTFIAIDGRWKLSNASLCQLASNALAPCTV